MDEYAALSHQRASEAQRLGRFAEEILPIQVYRNASTADAKDASSGTRELVTIREDDGIRHGTTKEALGRIRPAFPDWSPSCTT